MSNISEKVDSILAGEDIEVVLKEKKSLCKHIKEEFDLNEATEEKFTSVEDLDSFVHTKKSVVIYYVDGQYNILDAD